MPSPSPIAHRPKFHKGKSVFFKSYYLAQGSHIFGRPKKILQQPDAPYKNPNVRQSLPIYYSDNFCYVLTRS